MTAANAGALDEQLREGLRHAMSRLAAGVVMVTTTVEGRPWGLTVSACCSVSMDPPMLLVSLGEGTVSAKAIRESGLFGVSILGLGTLRAAQHGSARGASKFMEPFRLETPEGACESPVVAGAIAHIDCRVAEVVQGGDHVIFLGKVTHVVAGDPSDPPLVYHDRRYHRLTDQSDVGAAPPYSMWW